MTMLAREIFGDDHRAFRDVARKFFERDVAPQHREWEKAGVAPRSVWQKAGAAGLLCTTMPEEYGGSGADRLFPAILIEEQARLGLSGPGFSTHSDIVAPYLCNYGTEAQKREWLPAMARGDAIGAIVLTEPGAGSDLRSIRTNAVRDGDSWVLNGQKTFITNGGNADLMVTATKLDPNAKELTLICVEADRPGFSKGRLLEKIGLKGQDTSELFFDDVRVPVENRLGDENKGFGYLTHQLAWERTIIGIRAAASIEALIDDTLEYVRERKVFGKTVFDFQNTKFKLAECKAQATMLRVFVDDCLGKAMRGELSPEVGAMCKLVGSEMQGKVLDELLQLHGGYGFMSEYKISRAWVDARVARIYGGTSEIMKEIIARSL